MSIRSANSDRVLQNGNTYGEIAKNNLKASILSQFNDNNPSYFEVIRNDNDSVGAIITDNTSSARSENLDDSKSIILHPDEVLVVGDVFEYLGSVWITTKAERLNDLYYKGSIQKSNNILKFYSNSILYSLPCIIGKGNLGLETNKFLSIPADENFAVCGNTSDSSKISMNTRFILSGDAYNVIGTDKIANVGLLTLRIKEDVLNTEDDNLDLGIANYWSHQIQREIYILNGSSANLLYTNATLQLDVVCEENNVVVDNPTVTYATSSAYVATVSANGLVTCVGTGDAIITAYFGSVSASITIHGEMEVSNEYNIVITPSDTTLKLGKSLLLTASAMKNGVVDATKFFVWNLTNLDGSSNNYASIVPDGNINDKFCTILASNSSNVASKYVVIRCALSIDANVYAERQIKIVNLF